MLFRSRDRDAVLRTVKTFMPLSEENANDVMSRTRNVIVASMVGGGAVALSQGAATGIAFAALGISAPVLWGLVTSVFSFIPLIGAAGVWVPWAILLLVNGHWGKALILGLYGTFFISLIDNFLRPVIIGDATKLHTLVIFFAILGGLQVFGFLGLIMGPVVGSTRSSMPTSTPTCGFTVRRIGSSPDAKIGRASCRERV